MATTLLESVIHYRKKLDKNPDDEVIINVIHKLSKIPITIEILEATHIGKYIRKLSKRHDLVGSKAKIVLNKWRNVFANSVSEKNSKSHSVSKKENVNKSVTSGKHLHVSEEKTVHNHKETSHEQKHKHKNSLYNNASEQSSKKLLNGNSHVKENNSIETSNSLYKYEVKKESLKYKDYDPHADVSEGYNPECPELFPSESKITKKKCVVDTYEPSLKRKHNKVSDESDTEAGNKSHSKKLKQENRSTSDLDSPSESKSLEKKDKQNSHKEKSTSRTNNSHSVNEKSSSSAKSDKERSSKHKSSDSKKAKSKGSGDSSSDKISKSVKNTEVPMHSSEEFTSSNVTFEACLGFNDIVSFKKKKSGPSKLHLSSNSSSASSASTKKSSGDKKSAKKDSSSASKVKAPKESSHKAPPSHKTSPSHKELPSHKEKPVFEVPKPPKINLQLTDITSTLPEIQPNYKPLPRTLDFYSSKKKEVMSNEEAIMFTTSRREKTAVYSGRKNYYFTEVPTLVNCCTRVLIENIDDIECVGDLPYHLFRPILEKCTPAQLMNIENYNPHLIDETNEFWEIHCKRDYKLLKPLEHETWRDLYLRASDERERKLKSITASISANISKSNPVRQVKLAYVDSTAKPPRDVARKQAKNGTAVPACVPVKTGPPSKSTPRPTAPVINSGNSSSSSATTERPSFVKQKPKVAPLMAKTLKSMKQCFRRK